MPNPAYPSSYPDGPNDKTNPPEDPKNPVNPPNVPHTPGMPKGVPDPAGLPPLTVPHPAKDAPGKTAPNPSKK